MAARKGALAYITEVLRPVFPGGAFLKEWASLPEKDKADLKAWAEVEQDAFGLKA